MNEKLILHNQSDMPKVEFAVLVHKVLDFCVEHNLPRPVEITYWASRNQIAMVTSFMEVMIITPGLLAKNILEEEHV